MGVNNTLYVVEVKNIQNNFEDIEDISTCSRGYTCTLWVSPFSQYHDYDWLLIEKFMTFHLTILSHDIHYFGKMFIFHVNYYLTVLQNRVVGLGLKFNMKICPIFRESEISQKYLKNINISKHFVDVSKVYFYYFDFHELHTSSKVQPTYRLYKSLLKSKV